MVYNSNIMKEVILVSACLIGENCRYDGKNSLCNEIKELAKYYDLIPICPEVSGGLKTPRHPSEIVDGRVVTQKGRDVTSNYQDGAYWASTIVRLKHIKFAILKERSPSCGVHQIHNGKFDGGLIPGKGITTKKLEQMGVKVINEIEAKELLKEKKEQENNVKH